MSTSSILSLPYIQQSQAQKHVTHNEALRVLDAITQLAIKSSLANSPPPTAIDGDRFVVALGGTGDWVGKDGSLAVWDQNAWVFYPPLTGWTAWDESQNIQIVYNGTVWQEAVPPLQNLDSVGINTSADAQNRLSVSADSTILTYDTSGDHFLKINKYDPSDTATLLFQTNWSGRAEMGTPGSDDFEIKVSADGTNWSTALSVAHETGLVNLPQGIETPGIDIVKVGSFGSSAVRFMNNDIEHACFNTTNEDDLTLQVSADGTTSQTSFTVDRHTGQVQFEHPVKGATNPDFGESDLVNLEYSNAKGLDLITNGTGALGNAYNFPDCFEFDPIITPGLAGSVSFSGYYTNLEQMHESISIDPQKTYHLSTYMRRESVPGDWSNYNNRDGHKQYMGILAFDLDQKRIEAHHHMRYRSGGIDSYTVLTAPLSPGDTSISLSDASGWNDATSPSAGRGVIIFGYKNSLGYMYDMYSRYVDFNLFETSGVNKTTNVITLSKPLPPNLANPDHPNGTWPVGTRIANSYAGLGYKFGFFNDLILPEPDTWYKINNYMGGIDRSGTNRQDNFPPGTANTKVFWLPNYSNRSGGWGGALFPDTGTSQKVWFAGVSVSPDRLATNVKNSDGSVSIYVPKANLTTGNIEITARVLEVEEL